ncbi:MAG: TPM domain-containing protein [Pseudomonadota bacterium]
MVDVLTEDGQARLQSAVATAEKRTSAEIVVMIMRGVTDYRMVEVLIAAIGAIALPAALLPFTAIPAFWIWIGQIALFIALAIGLPFFSVGRFIVGAERISRDVEAAARAEFFGHGLRRTKGRAAVLLFVAVREHRVQVLYDDGAAAAVPEEAWADLADTIAEKMKSGNALTGLEEAVKTVADLLETDLPPRIDDEDELPNVIVH